MKAEVTSTKKLIAVIGDGGLGIFFRTTPNDSTYINVYGIARLEPTSLETLLEQSPHRKPVYEGDEIKLKF